MDAEVYLTATTHPAEGRGQKAEVSEAEGIVNE